MAPQRLFSLPLPTAQTPLLLRQAEDCFENGQGRVGLDKLKQAYRIDPSFVVTHTASLEDGPALYKTFRDKQDGCVKVVLRP